MASLARRIKLDNAHYLRQAILNGLRQDLQINVRIQHPATLENIAAAAAIAESGPVAAAQQATTPEVNSTGNPASTRPDNAGPVGELVAAIKEHVAVQNRMTATGGYTPGTAAAGGYRRHHHHDAAHSNTMLRGHAGTDTTRQRTW